MWQRLMAIARRKTPLAYVVLLCSQSTTPIFRLLRLYRQKITTPPLCPALPLDLCDPGLAFCVSVRRGDCLPKLPFLIFWLSIEEIEEGETRTNS